jgi:hypothetical protein
VGAEIRGPLRLPAGFGDRGLAPMVRASVYHPGGSTASLAKQNAIVPLPGASEPASLHTAISTA